MKNLTEAQLGVLRKLLLDPVFQSLIGAEEWDLTEDEEMILWDIIAVAENGK